jgi:hypothetical protein
LAKSAKGLMESRPFTKREANPGVVLTPTVIYDVYLFSASYLSTALVLRSDWFINL